MSAKILADIRRNIADLKSSRDKVAGSPVTLDEALKRINVWIEAEAERFNSTGLVAPFLNRTQGRVSVFEFHGRGDLGPMMAFFCGDDLRKKMGEALAGMDHGTGISTADRTKKLAILDGDLLNLEQQEEGILVTMEANGQTVNRRPDAAPAAVLEFQS